MLDLWRHGSSKSWAGRPWSPPSSTSSPSTLSSSPSNVGGARATKAAPIHGSFDNAVVCCVMESEPATGSIADGSGSAICARPNVGLFHMHGGSYFYLTLITPAATCRGASAHTHTHTELHGNFCFYFVRAQSLSHSPLCNTLVSLQSIVLAWPALDCLPSLQ